jgi:hypothetical protein
VVSEGAGVVGACVCKGATDFASVVTVVGGVEIVDDVDGIEVALCVLVGESLVSCREKDSSPASTEIAVAVS